MMATYGYMICDGYIICKHSGTKSIHVLNLLLTDCDILKPNMWANLIIFLFNWTVCHLGTKYYIY